jgi:hypothetical protein
MPASPRRIAFIHLAQAVRWDKAEADLRKLSSVFASNKGDAPSLRRVITTIHKANGLGVWAWATLPPDYYAALLTAWRPITALARNREAEVDAMRAAVDTFQAGLQDILDSLAPAHFTHAGFKIDNPEHMPREMCRAALDGLDYLKTMFKKRGVDAVLEQGVHRVILVPTSEGASAYFDSRSLELTVAVNNLARPGRFSDTFAGETLIHEFGHYVHLNYITGEAKRAWDAPWEGISDQSDPNTVERWDSPAREKKLAPLDIPTDYGKRNTREDFAETFMLFIIAPNKLSPMATYRMKQALSLSGLYGKPIMRIARSA